MEDLSDLNRSSNKFLGPNTDYKSSDEKVGGSIPEIQNINLYQPF